MEPLGIIRRLGFAMQIIRAERLPASYILIEEFGETRLILSPTVAGLSEKSSVFYTEPRHRAATVLAS
ncbi:hypothetical protein PQG67_02745 [Corynebacterium pseudodiphtheriticum]|uniref:hypothetical protein n=1 Tax=Corynebacterium pseudodiphtheriticum TaxID=37637 RepID=UPI00234D4FB0|nr:hypothetical protein [Corynebacterium pseudodiphtheriticum]MDC7068034.1 hypothetical protein [Corynebacterium pseudodiphtheriticum]MDC7084099.1 hypothetical protein [Corynebacterium pseudodiphtheriticum]MDC7085876.1 hypothetical protein [Corynebacterium pseudodiphtheriticum]